jgi:von Willebrand factor type A domain/Putative Tad-like Flp pilus-assembly
MIDRKRSKTREKGQSLLIISAAIVTFLALTAVVVDAGNDYVQRRQLQNSMDAGAVAGALKIGLAGSTNGDVADAVANYVTANGTDPTLVTAYYTVQDSSGNVIVVRTGGVATYGRSNPVPTTLTVNGSSYPVVGVQVEGTRTFNTYFAGVVGFPQLSVPGSSAAYINKGVCNASGLFPLALNNTTFNWVNGFPVIHYEQTDPSYTYQIYEKQSGSANQPGNFGWLTWNGDSSSATLAYNIQNTLNNASGSWSVKDNIPGSSGNSGTNNVIAATQWYIDNNVPVIIPIFDTTSSTGSNTLYHVVGFAKFHIVSIDTSGNPKSIKGKFQSFESASDGGGCASFGGTAVKNRPPIDTSRTVLGTVRIQKLTPLGSVSSSSVHVPVDVALVLDISTSMNDGFGSASKIQAAKNALTNFTSSLTPTLGDQAGLVVFPLNNGSGYNSGASYNYSCAQNGSSSNYYFGQVLNTLTNNVASVNTTINSLSANGGGTPTASGLSLARQLVTIVTGGTHRASNVSVVVLASDGLANIRLNGQWTGFAGTTFSSVACNSGAEQDAVQQSDFAKADSNGDGVPDAIIYTIAIGTGFDPALLQTLASTDTDPAKPHYFRASDATTLASIYAQISNQVKSISGSCRLIETEAFAPNAVLSVRNPDGSTQNLTTNDIGEFVIPNAASGTYQVTGASTTINGVTYNIPTDGVGGAQISWPISMVAGTESGTYKGEVALKASTAMTCGD